jgi:predicted nucleic acid-binding protein
MKKLVINANILFSLVNEASVTSQIVRKIKTELHSPCFALVEIKKYEAMLKVKMQISDFESCKKRLEKRIIFRKEEEYQKEMQEIIKSIPDKKDVEYLALALKEKVPLWSNDKELKKQSYVMVLSTREILELIR